MREGEPGEDEITVAAALRRFTELMLEGAGVAEVLEALAELIDNPVIVRAC
jgi:hypothetical protein